MDGVFDDWVDKYDAWFESPIGRIVKRHETDLLMELLEPAAGELILDAGCGTGLFTLDLLGAGARAVGLELSLAMLRSAANKMRGRFFTPVRGDMLHLPFDDDTFDKALSVTAIEFIAEGGQAVSELFRVTKPGGLVLAATLNRLSPWAARRRESAKAGHSIFRHVVFRSPDELKALAPVPGRTGTAIHFPKDSEPSQAEIIEQKGRQARLDTGAFAVACWRKPH